MDELAAREGVSDADVEVHRSIDIVALGYGHGLSTRAKPHRGCGHSTDIFS
jgi:hypothetical protein